MNDILITTNRLLLKGISPYVIHEVFIANTVSEIKNFFGVDDKGYQHFKMMHEKGMETFRLSLFLFLLVDKSSNQFVGECGFHTWNKTHRRAELYYSMRDDVHKGQGFMKEALGPVIKYGFEKMNLHRIEALVAAWNTPSLKLLKGNGFQFEGTMREDYIVDDKSENSDCYSLLKHEWRDL